MGAGLSMTDKLLGRILADRYQILHRLGEGAMGVVYKARHVKIGRLFAVKVLHARALLDSKVARRFEREAELAGRLRHPNVIGVVDVGEVDGTRYMVMDFAEGPDLAHVLDEAPMPAERIIRLVRQLLDGLHHAHEHGLIHRDFKPENVIVERDGHGGETPRIVDFGIALLREGGDSVDGQGRLTTNGLVLGTPHYMAPEQAVADPIDHRIDLFALGIVVYEMLAGRLPFDGSGAEVARANLLVEPPPIRQRVPHLEVDPLLEAFARRLMAKKRSARPATAKAARELLELIERDRAAAAVALGVPVARSGRAPAETEAVVASDPTEVMAAWPETLRMKPTPRSGDPLGLSAATTGPVAAAAGAALDGSTTSPAAAVAEAPHDTEEDPWAGPGGDAVPPGAPAGSPLAAGPPVGRAPWPARGVAGEPPHGPGSPGGPGAAPGSPAMVFARPPARAPAGALAGSPRRPPHRDTALRTPLGWQTSSLPGRRRSWLIGGGVVGVAGIAAAAVLSLWWANPDEPGSSDRAAIASPVPAVAAAPASARTDEAGAARAGAEISGGAPAPADRATPSTTDAAARGSSLAPAAGRPQLDAAPARPGGDGRHIAAVPGRTRGKPPGIATRDGREPASSEPEPAPERVRERQVRAPEVAEQEARRVRADPPPGDPLPVVPSGISAAELGKLFDEVKAEIEQLPEAGRRDLYDQLAMLNIMRAMRESQQARDAAAAHLAKLRQRVRDRKAGR